jgi:hypothetical protein
MPVRPAPATSRSRVLDGLSVRQHEARQRAAHAVSLQRRQGLSLTSASRRAGTTPQTVLRHFGSSYHLGGGRHQVAAADREPFLMNIASAEEGDVARVVRGSRRRALVAAHRVAVDQAVKNQDDSGLAKFRGKRVAGLTLLTDLDELTRQAQVGQLDFLEIYSTSN